MNKLYNNVRNNMPWLFILSTNYILLTVTILFNYRHVGIKFGYVD